MKCWQICEGNFVPRSSRWGRHFELWEDDIDIVCSAVTGQKYRTVCFNDSKTDIDFDALQPKLAGAFDRMFPEKSTFEI